MCGRQPLVALCPLQMRMQWQNLLWPPCLPACSSQPQFLRRMSSCTAQSCCLEFWSHRSCEFRVWRWCCQNDKMVWQIWWPNLANHKMVRQIWWTEFGESHDQRKAKKRNKTSCGHACAHARGIHSRARGHARTHTHTHTHARARTHTHATIGRSTSTTTATSDISQVKKQDLLH